MKVAITLNTSWNIYNFRLGLIRALLDAGHEVVAIAPKDDFSDKLEENGCTFVPIQMENTGSNPWHDYQLYRQLKKVYRIHRPTIIFHFTIKPNIYGTLAAHVLGIPVINNVSGLGTVFLSNGLASTVAKKLYRWAFSHAHLVFFQNADDRETFLTEISLPQLPTELVPGSGINLSSFQPYPLPEVSAPVFLMVARLIIDKGVNEYIEAAKMTLKKHPLAKFQLLGKLDPDHARGIPATTIEEAVQAGVIEYLGETEDVKLFLEKATCVVLPSYREGTPRTMLEAAACGRPVITTDVPGCREVVINGQTGLLCEVKSAEDLHKKMEKIGAMSHHELEIWGRNGRQLIEDKFDEQIVVCQYLKHASNIINQLSSE
ncbi:glycosyltransferase family 4 protein [Reichenbachiella carrageenanivorans]|uniref:Glycosyltransferase family 4 protein n=1 Tax=Reichenbachiella carrageenanivorans TaxID=2979869 RepID=A0ABY6D235_9BACT|nr:glycosyltransferase family 4 protein [Reichenbachiella carrageenanivorans]UXX80221.1 glycosyltransferase family 4 protein [Reichenbachiella carrageenanivorans]